MVISGRSRGGDARTHNIPLTGIYKVICAQVLAYAWFYKSEKKCTRTQNLAFVQTYTFWMKSTESFINKTPGLLLIGPKSSFQIKVHLVWCLEEDWRGTESKLLEVQCEVSEVSDDLGYCDVCWCWSVVFYQVQCQSSPLPGDFGALYAFISWQTLWRCWFPFPVRL